MISVVRADGTTFKAPPSKVGVEGELYTRYEIANQKDLTIEHWFAQAIESPFAEVLARLLKPADIIRSPLPAKNFEKEQELRELGFIVPTVVERVRLSKAHRRALDSYLAALLVRNPKYLAKLVRFHDQHGTPLPSAITRDQAIKTVALKNMLSVFELYRDHISQAHLGLLFVEGEKEFLFSDAGITANEPWHAGPIPFDIHAPLTPKLAVEVLPVPDPTPRSCFIMRVNNRGVARMNRIALQSAERFVFCRSNPPISFIRKHFGKPAPRSIGMQLKDGNLETVFDRSRDRA